MAKQITLTIHILPATAVRAGRSQAGETTVTLSDDDLAALTPAQRETLALHLEGASFPAPWAVRGGCHYGAPLHRYASPVADASLETIAALLDQRAAVVRDQVLELEREQAEADAKVAEVLAAPVAMRTVELNSEGKIVDCGGLVSVELPQKLPYVNVDRCSAAVRKEYNAAYAARDQAITAARVAALPMLQDVVREREAAEAARQEEYAVEYARLPEALRDRDEAGFAKPSEITAALHRMWLWDAAYDPDTLVEDWYDDEVPESLTDAEFEAVRRIEALAPEGAECQVLRIYPERAYRDATDDDDPSDVDSDGEVRIPDADRVSRLVVRVSWTRAGCVVAACVPVTHAAEMGAVATPVEKSDA